MNDPGQQEIEDRRNFLKSAGRFAAITPPAITLLLSASLTSDAIAHSAARNGGDKPGNNGWGNGGNDGGNKGGEYR